MKEFLSKLLRGERLTEAEAGAAMSVIMDGNATPAQIGALLAAIAVRGETIDEAVGFARTMRARALPIRSQGAVDTCGTGGDCAGTLNVSTIASLVVAAAGVSVVKHGNRAASSRCGSADVLEALGVKIDAPLSVVQRCLDQTGWTFLFAPAFHAATRHAVGPRKELGVRTIFNILGPLTNPGLPEAQVVGVPRPELAPFVAECLLRLGVRRAWVVHGQGLDELTLTGPTHVAAADNGVREFIVTPEDAGLPFAKVEDLAGGDAAQNAAIALAVLKGEQGAPRNIVLLNSAAALVVAGRAPNLAQGVERAAEAIDAGHALSLLERVRAATQAPA
ncbi:MAG: anthranilate phosphoribosyltransferase [Vicinamibacteria bacterium]|jgi:anthranilate phosphoribosyltransferase|nr:anthranilate phosphoribosyltransferase [Vicinamibacteria bacterium]